MNVLQKAWSVLTGSTAKAYTPGETRVLNQGFVYSEDNTGNYYRAHSINDTIYSINNLIKTKVEDCPWNVYKIKDEKSLKLYQGLMSKKQLTGADYKKALDYKTKGLELYDGDSLLNNLLKYPNPDDTFSQLVGNSTLNKNLSGARLIQGDLLTAGADRGKPSSLRLLPSHGIVMRVERSWPFRVLSYEIPGWGGITFSAEEVMHDRFYDPIYHADGSHLFGLSPLRAALRLTDRSNSENTAAAAAFHHGGPAAIIYVDDIRMEVGQSKAQVNSIKEILTEKNYAGAKNKNKMAVSGYKMGVTPIGLSPVELNIIESEKWSLRRFCNVFNGIPSQLLNDTDRATYNTVSEAEKALATRGALPHLNTFRNAFNRQLHFKWGYKDKGIYVDYDSTVYTELQEDLGKKWAWVERLPVPNGYKLDLMGLDHPENQEEFMNTIIIPSGTTTSDDLIATETETDLETGLSETSEDPGRV